MHVNDTSVPILMVMSSIFPPLTFESGLKDLLYQLQNEAVGQIIHNC